MTEYRRQCILMDRYQCPCCPADGTKRQIRRIAKKRDRRVEGKRASAETG